MGEQLEQFRSAVAQLEALLPDAPIVAFAQDPELRYTWILNPALGLHVDQVIGKTDAELGFHQDTLIRLEGVKRAVLATGSPARQEVLVKHAVTERWYDLFVQPQYRDGAIVGILSLAFDLTERKQAEQALAERESRYRALFSSIDEGYCLCEMITDQKAQPVDYRFLEVNPLFERMTGLKDALGRTAKELVPGLEAQWVDTYARVALGGEQLRFQQQSEVMGRCFDVFAAPVEGKGRFVIVFCDVTERVRQEDRIRLLANEARHRTKNILAIVQAVARQTTGVTATDYRERLSQRIGALARSHDLMVASDWRGVDMHELVRSQLAYFADLIDSRLRIEGPPLAVKAEAAEAISIALHELATNAGKYGALSSNAGRVAVTWAVESGRFLMRWAESDGPPVTAPEKQGFGSVVVQRLAQMRLQAEVRHDFAATGVVWQMSCPMSEMT